jgi:integrase
MPLSPTERVLREVPTWQAADRLRPGSAWHRTTYVVHDRAGRALRPTQCVACAQGAGLPSSVGLHTLRQSAASVMLSAGVPLKVVSEVFGHANVAMSMPVKLGKVGTGRPRGTAPMVWIPLLARSNNATHPPARIIAINGPGERGKRQAITNSIASTAEPTARVGGWTRCRWVTTDRS